jgi:hypothetical protein
MGVTSRKRPIAQVLQRDDIDLVDIACPNDMHKDIAIAAAKRGKMILCEKATVNEQCRRPENGPGSGKRPACRTWSGIIIGVFLP